MKNPFPPTISFDFATCLDCLHDMSHPEKAAEAIHAALKPDGTWFIVDVDGRDTFEENLADNPIAGFAYNGSLRCFARRDHPA